MAPAFHRMTVRQGEAYIADVVSAFCFSGGLIVAGSLLAAALISGLWVIEAACVSALVMLLALRAGSRTRRAAMERVDRMEKVARSYGYDPTHWRGADWREFRAKHIETGRIAT